MNQPIPPRQVGDPQFAAHFMVMGFFLICVFTFIASCLAMGNQKKHTPSETESSSESPRFVCGFTTDPTPQFVYGFASVRPQQPAPFITGFERPSRPYVLPPPPVSQRWKRNCAQSPQPSAPPLEVKDMRPPHKEMGACAICLDSLAKVAFIECRHLCLCEGCSGKFVDQYCPICRHPGERETFIYA